MKFRYKVLFTNLILLSIGLGLVGYLMINKNFELAKQAQLKNAIMQNNIVQSSVEYELLQYLNSSDTKENNRNIQSQLSAIGERISASVRNADSTFYIYFDENRIYSNDRNEKFINKELFENLTTGNKNYNISSIEGKQYIYVTSQSVIDDKILWIISRSDASEAYKLLDNQINYFRIIVIIIIFIESLAMYIISRIMTKPLEQLNHVSESITNGEYSSRADVKSHDEVGLLAEKFNVMAQAVGQHVDELNDMVHRREQFVADFTHEIKTPMTSIIGYADTMRSIELPRDEQIMALSYIFSEGKRLENMSQKLFELIYLRQHDIEKCNIHVQDLFAEVKKVVEPLYENKELCLQMSLEDMTIYGNRDLLVTAFVNILDNARKASVKEQKVYITGTTDGEYYSIQIKDCGIGMTAEQIGKIYDEFYMADKSRSRKEGGAGIGMSLVAIILEHHGAEIDIQSKIQEGTTVTVRIPVSGTARTTETEQ